MKKEHNLEFCFKGTRTYVQGPDIFDAVVKKLNLNFDIKNIRDIKYSAYEMLHSNADMILIKEFNKSNYTTINSVITFKIKEEKYHVVVFKNEKEIQCSTPYSEDIVRTKSIIDKNIIYFKNTLEDSISELIVSMNKYFLQETQITNGQWIVTKFEYDKLINLEDIKDKELSLKLINNFNNRLTKSVIYVNNKPIGFLYFSLI